MRAELWRAGRLLVVAFCACGIARSQRTGAASQAPVQTPVSSAAGSQNTSSGGAAAQNPEQGGASATQIVQPKLVHMVKPVYPDALIQGRFSGAAVVRFTIAKDGSVRDVKAVTTNHFSEPSVAAVQQWTFEPMRKGGEAVDSEALARIVFTVEFTPGTNHASSSAAEVVDNGAATAKQIVAENPESSLVPAIAQPAPLTEVTEAKLLHSVSPSYHVEAGSSIKGGTVVVRFTIRTDGTVSNVKYVSGPEEFGDVAVAAVKQWTYEPATVGGRAVATEGRASFVFKGAPPPKSDGTDDATKPADSTNAPAPAAGAANPGTAEMSSPPQKQMVHVDEKVAAAKLIHQVPPHYPETAKNKGIEGTVVLFAIIGKDGTIETLKLISGPPELVESAMEAARQWRYSPALVDGKTPAVDTTISVVYKLN